MAWWVFDVDSDWDEDDASRLLREFVVDPRSPLPGVCCAWNKHRNWFGCL